jgi:hypothetical protein
MKLAATAFLLLSLSAFGQVAKPDKEAAHPIAHDCKAGQDEWCPPAEWWADYDHMKEIGKPYIMPKEVQDHIKQLQAPYVMPKDVADLANGIANRLAREIPSDFMWDESKQKAVKLAPTPPAAQAPTVPSAPKK